MIKANNNKRKSGKERGFLIILFEDQLLSNIYKNDSSQIVDLKRKYNITLKSTGRHTNSNC